MTPQVRLDIYLYNENSWVQLLRNIE